MPRRLNDQVVEKEAVAVSGGGAPLPIVATKIDGTGFSRARFKFHFAAAATTASLSTGLGVWQAATSGATFALIAGASAAAVTSGVISGSANPIIIIDVPISPSTPWLQMSGSFNQTGNAHAASVELYHGVNRPPTHTEQQVIVV